LRSAIKAPLAPADQAYLNRWIDLIQSQIDTAAWIVAYDEGKELSVEQAIEKAIKS